MTKWYVSHSPCRLNDQKIFFKSVKTTKGIGGMIVANGYGKTKEEAEKIAKQVAALPVLIEALEQIATWDSYKDHPIGKCALNALKEIE